ncbi:hypothetical protein BC332_30843 [Capsicum chinense]|nr:hypothetical protein BC332_30843 [Capsicum chinense]
MEKIIGPLFAGSLRLASTDVKVNPIVSCLIGKVVDRNLRLFGALRVVDGSTFTISPGTNPQATLLMLGCEEHDSEREKKGNPFMAAYLRTFKNSCDSLASINAPVSQSDMFTFLLAGLPSKYESFVTTANLQRPKPTMATLWSSLLLHESWLQQIHPITMLMILYNNRVYTRPRTRTSSLYGAIIIRKACFTLEPMLSLLDKTKLRICIIPRHSFLDFTSYKLSPYGVHLREKSNPMGHWTGLDIKDREKRISAKKENCLGKKSQGKILASDLPHTEHCIAMVNK